VRGDKRKANVSAPAKASTRKANYHPFCGDGFALTQKVNIGPNSVRQLVAVQVGNPATLVVQIPLVLGRA
jgi:hypothetical protein